MAIFLPLVVAILLVKDGLGLVALVACFVETVGAHAGLA